MEEKDTIITKLGRLITKLGNALMMNLLFLVCCIPVVTAGQAWCALLSAVRYQIRGDSWWNGFKFGFKTRFLRGTVAWCAMLVLNVWMTLDVLQYTTAEVSLMYPISACIMLALTTMLTTALMTLNVYIPTDITTWVRNAVSLIFKVPLQLLASAALLMAPILLCLYRFDYFYYFAMVFVVAYFILAAFAVTILLKNALMDLLLEARADGTLIAEEGKAVVREEDEESE